MRSDCQKNKKIGSIGIGRLIVALLNVWFATQVAAQVSYEANAPISTARFRAAVIHQRLTGTKIPIDSSVLVQMEALIAAGNELGAARIATDQPGFYSRTLLLVGNKLSNLRGSARVPFNDISATLIGFAKDDIDARNFLSANYLYRLQNLNELPSADADILESNNHYAFLDGQLVTNPNLDLRPLVVQVPQRLVASMAGGAPVPNPDSAGILTSRAFLQDCANDGTNRRCWEKIVKNLTCNSMEEVADSSVPEAWIGRDVTRAPAGDPSVFQTTCKSCHANMDSNRSAFAFITFADNQVLHGQVNAARRPNLFTDGTGVARKLNQAGEGNFQQAMVITSDEWVQQAVSGEAGAKFGWRDAEGNRINSLIVGRGLKGYGKVLAQSEAFSRCLVTHAFENLCRRSFTAEEKTRTLRSVASAFENPKQGNYKIRWLFERVATLSACTGK